jgi:hypothetical protein
MAAIAAATKAIRDRMRSERFVVSFRDERGCGSGVLTGEAGNAERVAAGGPVYRSCSGRAMATVS